VDRRPAVLAAHHASGVTKKAKTNRKAVMSSKARRRHEKHLGRAEAVMDRTAVKVQKSKGKAKIISSRKKAWEEINEQVQGLEGKPKLSKKARTKAEEDAMVAAFYADDDGDEQMEEAGHDTEAHGNDAEAVPSAVQPVSIPTAPPPAEDEEEIL
jgi:hypothetical protein